MFRRFGLVVLVLSLSVFATEALKPVAPPESYISVGGIADLRDDVYSADLGWTVEVAPCNCFSVYTDMSYRFVSYEWDATWTDQNHEALNLHVNGLNESFVGMKFFPIQYFGIDLSWSWKIAVRPGVGVDCLAVRYRSIVLNKRKNKWQVIK